MCKSGSTPEANTVLPSKGKIPAITFLNSLPQCKGMNKMTLLQEMEKHSQDRHSSQILRSLSPQDGLWLQASFLIISI